MKFGVAIGTNMSIQEIGHISKVVEDSGFDYITIVDTPSSSPDVHVGLTVAAMNTKRIQIGQGVVDPYTYQPVTIANIACTLHQPRLSWHRPRPWPVRNRHRLRRPPSSAPPRPGH